MEAYKISALAKIEKLSREVDEILGTIDKDAWNAVVRRPP